MANHKSALKRIKQTAKRTERNRYVRGTMRTHIKKVRLAIDAGEKENAREELHHAIRKIDKAAARGIIHKNQASRRISRLTRAVNAL